MTVDYCGTLLRWQRVDQIRQLVMLRWLANFVFFCIEHALAYATIAVAFSLAAKLRFRALWLAGIVGLVLLLTPWVAIDILSAYVFAPFPVLVFGWGFPIAYAMTSVRGWKTKWTDRMLLNWGVYAALEAIVVILTCGLIRWQASKSRSAAELVIPTGPAYSVQLADDQGTLLVCNRDRKTISRYDDPLGPHRRRTLIHGGTTMPELMFRADDSDAFYVTTNSAGSMRFESWALFKRYIEYPVEKRNTDWVAAAAEDWEHKRLWILGEWHGRAVVYDVRSAKPVMRLTTGEGLWTLPSITLDPPHNRGWIGSGLMDGALREIELDTGHVVRTVANVFGWRSVYDAARGLLWVERPYPGDVLGFEIDGLVLKHRIRARVGIRDIVLDPITGHLFANTYPFGELLHIDPQQERVIEERSCGRQCRQICWDATRDFVWGASVDGVYGLPMH